MKGTVKSVSRTKSGANAITIAKTDPLPVEDVILTNVDQWAFDDLRAALTGGLPVDVTTDPADGSVVSVKVG